jgi:hypothetical protein
MIVWKYCRSLSLKLRASLQLKQWEWGAEEGSAREIEKAGRNLVAGATAKHEARRSAAACHIVHYR